ncbi:MAG: endo-alpha-N-acetylgalactosaminidase family protein [Actinomycetaceae bacterium]|nr:endo-alpha-N-acetylgalactosaminidase family protein [Actinomycetaceae bacterium]
MEYTTIPQANMRAVAVDSTETSGEGANGPIDLVLDGNPATYWHTKWSGSVDPLPHWFVIDLGANVPNVARVTLTPRQSSNGSGRVGNYSVAVSTDTTCSAGETAATAAYTEVASGTIPAGEAYDPANLQPSDIDFTPTAARCIKVTYNSTWGGNSDPETVGSLAEFNASTAVETQGSDQPPTEGPQIVIPDGALEITDGILTVRTHPDFPQVLDYRVEGKQLAGMYGEARKMIAINNQPYTVNVGDPTLTGDGSSVSYPLMLPDLDGVTLTAKLTVRDGALTYTLTDITDPDHVIRTISMPGMALVSLNAKDEASTIYAARLSTDRAASGDQMITVKDSSPMGAVAYMITAANSELAAGFETNAIGANSDAQSDTDTRFTYAVGSLEGQNVGIISPASWVYRSDSVAQYDHGEGIGVDPDPMVKVKVVADANGDSRVDWQDGATATRDILTPANGRDDIKNYVVMRIPFNIVSQATHPFLRTLDDTKRISLATDNLGQEVLLKGYQAEGHDSAQGDYGGNYNERAGGLNDLLTLVSEGKDWNATFGIHVNATESYSEANCFADANNMDVSGVAAPCEVYLPPAKAWGWMNQAYTMNEMKDLASGNVLKRLEQLREDFPADSNLNWLYWDVYYKHGWQAQRFAYEMQQQGWRLGSEWAYSMPQYSTWSHWATDENYGGSANKGLNSRLIRYVENSYRDTFNPDPMLGNANIVDFEGWTGHVNYNEFIRNVWERNLPTKFLQQSDIRTWEDGKITFANGTEVRSTQTSISGSQTPTQRTITYDGATVFKEGGSYLLPWKDGGTNRLYYWNPGGSAQTWELTEQFSNAGSLTMFKLTDTGREKVADISISDRSVSLPATEANTAYVLYPARTVPEVKDPQWGQDSGINDPGFFSGTLDSYKTHGPVTIEHSDRANSFAQIGSGSGSLEQTISVTPGEYSAWAWIEIQPGKTRHVEVSVKGDGVTPAPAQAGETGEAVTSIDSSSALNSTASDEKRQTYYQRVPVHFSTTGSAVTITVSAGDGDAMVGVDDLRIVERAIPESEGAVADTIAFEDFENVDTGYYPFVTGSSNAGGDARTQLAKRHAPFSQSGWYGIVNDSRTGIEGQKYLDNVLDGDWSLMAHQENSGLILRTTESSVPLEYGHTYRLVFDYQAAFDGDYNIVIGHSTPDDASWTQHTDRTWSIPSARGAGWSKGDQRGTGTATFDKTFAVTTNQPAYIGVVKTGGQSQGDLVIDNFRVVDLGVQPVVSITGDPQVVGDSDTATMLLTTTVEIPEGRVSDVRHSVSVPDGWTLEAVTRGGDVVSGSGDNQVTSVSTWKLTMPRAASAQDVVLTATWTNADGTPGKGSDSLTVDPPAFPQRDLFKGHEELEVVSADSQEAGGEPAPSGYADAAIDDNPSTYWHTAWSASNPPYPHQIVIKVKPCDDAQCEINGLEYTQRHNADNGRAKGYEIYVSDDGQTWGDPVATGEFSGDLAPQFIPFGATTAHYVKLIETSPLIDGKPWGGAGEIRIGGKLLSASGTTTVTEVAAPAASDPSTCPVKPYVAIPSTEGVVYYIENQAVSAGTFSYEWGKSIEVTARAANGYSLADGVTAQWTFESSRPSQCDDLDPVVALEPVWNDKDGSFTVPSVEGITYSLDGKVLAPGGVVDGLAGKRVVVTAAAGEGYVFGEDSPRTFVHQFPTLPPYPSLVWLEAPRATDPSSCDVAPFVEIPQSLGVRYFINGVPVDAGKHEYAYGESVTVSVAVNDGFTLVPGATTTWTFHADVPAGCATPDPDPGTGHEPGVKGQPSGGLTGSMQHEELSQTGAQGTWLVAMSALVLMFTGSALLRRQARRQ